MKNIIKLICIALCLVMCLSLILSPVSFAQGHNHDCTGDNCTICLIVSVIKLISGEGFLALFVMAVMGFLQKSNPFSDTSRKNFCDITPINRKVKLTI